MRKYRSRLIGLGLGIVLGATMLQVILFAKDQSKPIEDQTISQERLAEEATKAGLVLLTEAQLDEKLKKAAADAQASASSPAADKPAKDASPSPSPTPSSSPKSDAEQSSDEKTTLYVGPGMSLTEVANGLKKLGLIEDSKDFISKAKPIAKKMIVGNAIFVGKPTYQQIMDELVRRK